MQGLHQFGAFSFDPASRELRRDGAVVPLGQRGLALLEALLAAGGEAVSKDELMAKGWPGVFVEEANLSVQIAALRKALGRAENGADWIATVPRIGYRFLSAGPPPVASQTSPTIAVLPFETQAGEVDYAYFADGFVEGLITALSRFRGFAVVSRSASFVHRGSTDLRDTAKMLGVRYLLDGSVRRRGEQLRVAIRLTEAESRVLWAEQFDGPLSDLFDFEDRIIERVVGLTEPEVRRAEIDRARRKRPESLDAYDLYLRALPHFRGTSPAARAEAIRLLEESVALDPGFASGLVHAAWAYERQDTFGSGMTNFERSRALELAEKAVTVGHDDPQVMAIAALVLVNVGHDGQRALAMLAEARRANPNNPTVLSLFAFTSVMLGDLMEGRAAFLHALAIAPTALDNYELLVGVASSHLLAGEYEDALDWALRSLAANNDWLGTYWTLAAAYAHLGRMGEARDVIARLLARAPGMRMSDIERIAQRFGPRFVTVVEGLSKAGLPE